MLKTEGRNLNSVTVEIKDVSFSYNSTPVLVDVNLTVNEKDFVCIVGRNGGGKTTLVKLMVGLLKPDTGTVRVFGMEPESACSKIGYMPQNVNLDPDFPADVMDVVLMGRLVSIGPYHQKDRDAAKRALMEVGLFNEQSKPFSELSEGQKGRVLIARVLAGEPEFLILDEPTANLDPVIERDFFQLLSDLNKRLTVIMVSHDQIFVSRYARTIVCVNRKVMTHPTCEISQEFLSGIYNEEMMVVRHDHESTGE